MGNGIMGLRVYFMGIGGIGMSGVACLAKTVGFEVAGSDKLPLYSPAKELLESQGISVFDFKEPETLKDYNPDLVVVGNVVKGEDPLVRVAKELAKPLLSFPEFLSRYFFTGRKVLCCAGTHGKTTTTALLSEALTVLGEDPTYLVGGVLRSTDVSFRLGQGTWAVVEGDEYPSAFFDPSPKFAHYKPYGLIVTSLEYDHADAYPNFEGLIDVFRRLIAEVSPSGLVVLNGDYPVLRELARFAKARVIFYGKDRGSHVRLLQADTTFDGSNFKTRIVFDQEGKIKEIRGQKVLSLPGDYNALNLLAVYALLYYLGFEDKRLLQVLSHFKGVKRRQEVLLVKNGLIVVDDFAHHPTAVRETLVGLKSVLKPLKVVLFFEPRTNTSKRKVFQKDYEEVLSLADWVFIKKPPLLESLPREERLDLTALVKTLMRCGRTAYILEDGSASDGLAKLGTNLQNKKQNGERALILFMSSSFMREEIHNLLKIAGSHV